MPYRYRAMIVVYGFGIVGALAGWHVYPFWWIVVGFGGSILMIVLELGYSLVASLTVRAWARGHGHDYRRRPEGGSEMPGAGIDPDHVFGDCYDRRVRNLVQGERRGRRFHAYDFHFTHRDPQEHDSPQRHVAVVVVEGAPAGPQPEPGFPDVRLWTLAGTVDLPLGSVGWRSGPLTPPRIEGELRRLSRRVRRREG